MASASLNGLDVVDCTLRLPRRGLWTANVTLESEEAPVGPVTLDFHGLAFSGAVWRAGVSDGSVQAVVLGGSGKLGRPVTPRAYRSTPLRVPLADLLATAEQRLAPTAQPEVLEHVVGYWSALGGNTCGAAVDSLLSRFPGSTWRVLRDGTLWLGFDTWGPSALASETLLEDMRMDRTLLYAEVPTVFPGESLNGRRISLVEHRLEDAILRTEVWFE